MTQSASDRIWIPAVPRDRIVELAQRVVPVKRGCGDRLHYLDPMDPFCIAFTWDPQLREEAVGLQPLCDIRTNHRYCHIAIFKPSIAEVLAQIPGELLGLVVAFTVVEWPDVAEEPEAAAAGYHVVTTRLYVEAENGAAQG